MDADKMRAEFENWASIYGFDLRRMNEGYFCRETGGEWLTWQSAYAAGRMAEQSELERREQAALERLRAELRAAKFGRTSRNQKDTTPPTT